MNLSLHAKTDVLWQLEGCLSVKTIKKIMRAGYDMVNKAPDNATLEVDLSGVKQADSASVALLLDWWRYANKHKKTIVFIHLPQKMQDIIHVSNLKGILPVS